jgi:hypothetical protein
MSTCVESIHSHDLNSLLFRNVELVVALKTKQPTTKLSDFATLSSNLSFLKRNLRCFRWALKSLSSTRSHGYAFTGES